MIRLSVTGANPNPRLKGLAYNILITTITNPNSMNIDRQIKNPRKQYKRRNGEETN